MLLVGYFGFMAIYPYLKKLNESQRQEIAKVLVRVRGDLNAVENMLPDVDHEEELQGDDPLSQVAAAIEIVEEVLEDFKKLKVSGKTIEASDSEVMQAFEDAHKSLKEHGWGTENQIKTQNRAFDLAKEKGWDWESDHDFTAYALKATVEEILDKGLECYLKHVEAHEA